MAIQLDPELEQKLLSAAEMNNQSLDDYVRKLVDGARPYVSSKYNPAKTVEEFRQAMLELGKLGPKDLSGVDTTWDRESIYDDHD